MGENGSWDLIADVIIVGYGGAGASAAIEASSRGAEVLVLEKAEAAGGNTRLSYAYFCSDDCEATVDYIEAIRKLEGPRISKDDRDLIRAFALENTKNNDWLKSLGGEIAEFAGTPGYPKFPPGPGYPKLPGAKSIRIYSVKGHDRGGQNLFRLLDENVKKNGIKVLFKVRATQLLTNNSGEVIGVQAEDEGAIARFAARRGIILASGGFEYSEDLKAEYLPGGIYYAIGARTNTGDGIKMAAKLGAALWHMNCVAGYPAVKKPEYDHAFPLGLSKSSFVFVDKYGKRFVNEGEIEAHLMCLSVTYFDPVALDYPRIPCYLIFDNTNLSSKTLCPEWSLYGEWSVDNKKELEKGWIIEGYDFADLGNKIGLNPELLSRTLHVYNESCKLGYDKEFGRRKPDLMPLNNPPFYAIELWPSLLNTQGGPKRNDKGQVLDSFGEPIKRLYSAGE